MYIELKENKVHGTKEFPYMDYHIQATKTAFQIPVHWHEEIEIIYVIKEPLKVVIEGEEYDSKDGDIFIVNPRELHFMGARTTGADYHTFVFPLDLISFRSDDELDSSFFEPIRSGKNKFKNLVPQKYNTKELRVFLENLVELYHFKDKSRQLKIRLQLLSFFDILFTDEMIHSEVNAKSNLGRDIFTFVQKNYTDELKLSDIANELNLSEKYLSRYFKQNFRINLTQYICHLRTKKAKKLLESTDIPITEVAFQSGFQNISYFIRTFHKIVGKSPLQYRNDVFSKINEIV